VNSDITESSGSWRRPSKRLKLLLELQDVARFRRANQLAAYVVLTPSQYSSADKVRMGRITLLRTRRKFLDERPCIVGKAA
jgi:transposase